MKRLFAAFMVGIFILASVPVHAVTISNLSAKDRYLKLEENSIKKIKDNFSNSELGKYVDFYGELLEKSYKANSTIEVVIPGIETRKYVAEESFDCDKNYVRDEMKAYVNNEHVATVEVILDNEILSLKVPELFNKYITAELNDIHTLVKKFDPETDLESVPNKFVNPLKLNKELKPTALEEVLLKASGLKYAKLLEENFLKDEFFSEVGTNLVEINGEKLNLNGVKYSINQKEFGEGTINILKTLKDDAVLINLMYDKMAKVYNIYKDAGYPEYAEEFPKKEDMMLAFNSLIEELNESELDENNVIEVSVYYDNYNNVLKRDLNVIEGNEKINVCSLFTSKDAGYYALVTEESKLEDFVTVNGNSENHKFVLTYETFDYDSKYDVMATVTKSNSLDVKVTKLAENQYNLEFILEGQSLFNIDYKLNNKTDKNYNMDMNFNLDIMGQTYSLNTSINVDTNVTVIKPDVKNNEVNINTTPNEELMKLVEENANTVLEKIEGKFGTAFYYQEIKGLIEMFSSNFNDMQLKEAEMVEAEYLY